MGFNDECSFITLFKDLQQNSVHTTLAWILFIHKIPIEDLLFDSKLWKLRYIDQIPFWMQIPHRKKIMLTSSQKYFFNVKYTQYRISWRVNIFQIESSIKYLKYSLEQKLLKQCHTPLLNFDPIPGIRPTYVMTYLKYLLIQGG